MVSTDSQGRCRDVVVQTGKKPMKASGDISATVLDSGSIPDASIVLF